MPTPEKITKQVNDLVRYLVEVSLANDQNFAFQRKIKGGHFEITFPQAEHVSVSLKDRAYHEIYEHLARERAYVAKMPDGALVQMMYSFKGENLERHRLAFFPAPHLEEFQNNPDIYLEDDLYADVIAKSIVPIPLRFDYDAREGIHKEIVHPISHLTLGHYENCRIPVTSPLTPYWFVNFILRNFYHTAFHKFADRLPIFEDNFEESIVMSERGVVHIQVPTKLTLAKVL